jgi:EAL domain-containing protein (putative c-di-GMP-specific phosphodiesterase class I)
MQAYIEDSCIRIKASPKAETDFERAVSRGQFALRYQPWIDPRSGRAGGIEGVLCWRHAVLGDIPQSRFLPVARALGFANVIVEQILHETCAHAHGWMAAGLPALHLAVNVPAENLASPEFAFLVAQCLDDNGLAPENLDIVVELRDALAHADSVTEPMCVLRELGVSLTIANVDSESACMGLVKLFPANRIKLDDYLVRGLSLAPSRSSTVDTIITLSHAKGMLAIATQVDTVGQVNLLSSELHCDLLQGSYYGQPLPADACLALLQTGVVMPPETAGKPEDLNLCAQAYWRGIGLGQAA